MNGLNLAPIYALCMVISISIESFFLTKKGGQTLNPVKGNMYSFVSHTWNTVKGKCPHLCNYCYMTKWGEQKPIRFDEKELKTDLGTENFIFIGSSCDMFAREIPGEWIHKTLKHCRSFNNHYLFQSKNPMRFIGYRTRFPENTILGTTIESDIHHAEMGNAPNTFNRMATMRALANFKKTVTIEPIMDFTVTGLFNLIALCEPEWVNIGANTNHKIKLPEPSPDKIQDLIERLEKITEVKIKPNLKRLISQ